MTSHTQQSNLAGEFAVLSQMAMRGLVGALTMGNAKNVDILVTNPKNGKTFQVEVKTSFMQKPATNKTFESGQPFYCWPHLNQKNEETTHPSLLYCFVVIPDEKTLPKIFIVPSQDVAKYLKWENDKYWETPHKNRKTGKVRTRKDLAPNENTQRAFRINVKTNTNEKNPGKNYFNNWNAFD